YWSPQQYAAQNGALAVINVASAALAAGLSREAAPRGGPTYVVKKLQNSSSCPTVPLITAGLGLTLQLFQGEKHTGAEIFYVADKNQAIYTDALPKDIDKRPQVESFALMDRKTLRLNLAVHTEDAHGENVIG